MRKEGSQHDYCFASAEALQRMKWVDSCTCVPNTPVSGTTQGSEVARNSLAKSTALFWASQERLNAMSIFFFTFFTTGKHLLRLSKGSCPGSPSQAALITPVPTPSHQTNLQNNIFVHQESVHHPWHCSCVAFLIKVVSSQLNCMIFVSLLELELHQHALGLQWPNRYKYSGFEGLYMQFCLQQSGRLSFNPSRSSVRRGKCTAQGIFQMGLWIWNKLDKMGKWNSQVFLRKTESLASFTEFLSSNSVGRENIQSANSNHDVIYNQILDFTKRFKKEKCSEKWLILVCLGTFAGVNILAICNQFKKESDTNQKTAQNWSFLPEFNAEVNEYQNPGISSRSKILRFVVGDSNASSAKDIYQAVPFQKEQNKQEYFSRGYLETRVV